MMRQSRTTMTLPGVLLLAVTVVLCSCLAVDAFLVAPSSGQSLSQRTAFFSTSTSTSTSASKLAATKSTLTDSTLWKLRFVLKGVNTEKGKKVDEIFTMTAKFLEEEGYEPPQGALQQISIDSDRLVVTKSYWKLSEDPEDRKDGLWIWGLFKEPLYPYLLLQLETAAVPMAGQTDKDVDSILPLQLYAQINHSRDETVGVVLEGADLKVRQVETIKADPFGGATVDVFEEKNVGTLSIVLV